MISPQQIRVVGHRYHSGLGAPAKMSLSKLVMGAVYHEIQTAGNMGEHTQEVTGQKVSHSALSQRRQNLDSEVFKGLMKAGLKPLAQENKHPWAFYRGLRLLGIDGSEFSVPNTPELEPEVEKAESRRGKAAFAKIRICTISELAIHNPIAAAIG